MSNSTCAELYILEPTTFKLDGGAMFGIIPRPLWMKKSPPDQENRIELTARLILYKYQDRVILVDTGLGDYHDEKFVERFALTSPKDALLNSLKEINLTYEDITDLVITHLHFDHAGGIAKKEGDKLYFPFPKAKLHLHSDHYDYAKGPTARDSGSFHVQVFDPIIEELEAENRINWLTDETGFIIEECELYFKVSHGHTPHLVHPYTKKWIYMSDLVPTTNHIRIPWVMGYDIYPGRTVEDKQVFLEKISRENLIAIYEHDPTYWGSTIKEDIKHQFIIGELNQRQEKKAYKVEN